MRYDQIVRAKDGKRRNVQHVGKIRIPDLWKTMEKMRKHDVSKKDIEAVYESWHLCHDLLKHIKRICKEQNADA